MGNLITAIAITVALAGCAPTKKTDCADLRERIDRDLRTGRIVSVEIVCDGQVIPQVVGSVISVPAQNFEDRKNDD